MAESICRMKYVCCFLWIGLMFTCFGAQPDVVIVYADDMGWGDVGYHGFSDVETPNIDALAKGGVHFSQGYVCASVCGPSRVGLLTGTYQQRYGIYGNPGNKGGLPTTQSTLFEMLKPKGYATGVIGKWGIGYVKPDMRPNARGVDYFYGFLGGSHDYYQSSLTDDGRANQAPIYQNDKIQPPIQDTNIYLTEKFSEEGVGFIKANKGKPICLYMAYNAVHSPWQVPKSYVERLKGLKTDDERRTFAAMVLALDDGVGALVKSLKEEGRFENTLFFFLSDNGTPSGQGIAKPGHKSRGETTMSNPGPFNGFKGDTYEGGIRVPFLVHWPAKLGAGAQYDQPVSNLDIVPTIAAAVGAGAPKGNRFDGVDLMPFLTMKRSEVPHETLYWRRGEDYAVRRGDWKLAFNDGNGPEKIELFNLVNDRGENKDVAQVYPERAQQMQNLFDAWEATMPEGQWGRTPSNRNMDYAAGNRIVVAAMNRDKPAAERRRAGKPKKKRKKK